MEERIFLAGASGVVGRRLSQLLVADRHHVVGTTRSADKGAVLARLGLEPVVVDVFDVQALRHAVIAARPDVVIHELTDLPPALDPTAMPAALLRTARLRDEGTRHLIAASVAAGVRRMIVQSIAFSIDDALLAFEQQVTDAPLVRGGGYRPDDVERPRDPGARVGRGFSRRPMTPSALRSTPTGPSWRR